MAICVPTDNSNQTRCRSQFVYIHQHFASYYNADYAPRVGVGPTLGLIGTQWVRTSRMVSFLSLHLTGFELFIRIDLNVLGLFVELACSYFLLCFSQQTPCIFSAKWRLSFYPSPFSTSPLFYNSNRLLGFVIQY